MAFLSATGFVVCIHCTRTDKFLCFLTMHETFLKEYFDDDEIPSKYMENKFKYRLEKDPITLATSVYEKDPRQRKLSFFYGDIDFLKETREERGKDLEFFKEEAFIDTILVEFYNKFQFKLQDFVILEKKVVHNFFKGYSLFYYQVEDEIPTKKNNTVWMSIQNMNNFLSFLPKSRSFHWSLYKTLEILKIIN